jgi:hypothetical protein
MAQEISHLLHSDISLIEKVLEKWGGWFSIETSLPNLGYPKKSSFLNSPINGVHNRYTTIINTEEDELSELIYKALKENPLFLKIAKISYVTCRGCTVLEKSAILINDNYNLGNNKETVRKKFKELEQNLKFYVKGLIHCYETL